MVKLDQMPKLKPVPVRVPNYIVIFLSRLKKEGRTDVFEAFMLFLLHEHFLDEFTKSIEENLNKFNLKNFEGKKRARDIKICPTKGLDKVFSDVGDSKYFVENYSRTEIQNKIGQMVDSFGTIFVDLLIKTRSDQENVDYPFLPRINFPDVHHTTPNKKSAKEIQLTFTKDTPLNQVVRYLKEVLRLKNHPTKKKLTLGRGYKFLQAETFVKLNKDKYKKGYSTYTHTHILEIINQGEKTNKYTEDSLLKNMNRVKKIRREINTIKKDK